MEELKTLNHNFSESVASFYERVDKLSARLPKTKPFRDDIGKNAEKTIVKEIGI